jgi:hypothetical protein
MDNDVQNNSKSDRAKCGTMFCLKFWDYWGPFGEIRQTKMHVSPNVVYEEIEGFVVILDLVTEAYYMFDPVAAAMWKALLESDNDNEALDAVQNRFAVERVRLQTDLEAFKRRCVEHGFLQEKESKRRIDSLRYVEARQAKCLVLRAWWALFRTVRSLSTHGFARTYQEYSRIPIPKENSSDHDLLKPTIAAFTTAENFFLMKSAPKDCVPRSLALFRFLRLAGLPVEHCIGVRRFPFAAHGWVEYRGHVVQDDPSRQLTFKILARISA